MEKGTTNKDSTSRRKFIKESVITAAGFSIVPRFVLGGNGYVAPSDKLYIACVGCGNEAHADITQLAGTPWKNSVIAYLCDVDERQAAPTRKEYPQAKFYHDWREMFEKEHKHFDAVTVAIPDHNHAIVGLHVMKLGKALYLQKPLTHDIYEARILTEAAKKYKVVTQMGNQLASADGVRRLKEYFDSGLIGDIQRVYNWTDRPIWPSGIPWPQTHPQIPPELNWDLWLGTAQQTEYVSGLVPERWRAWWDFGTGSLGDMGCHIIGPSYKLLGLRYPTRITCDVSRVYSDWGQEAYYPKSIPPSCKIRMIFKLDNGKELEFHWCDGGMMPPRPEGLDPSVNMFKDLAGAYFGGSMFVGTKGIIACGEGGFNPKLLPESLNKDIDIPQKYPRVKGGANGHYWQWINAAIAGYGNDYEGNAALPVLGEQKAYVDSPIEGYAGLLTEGVLMGNLVIRSFGIRSQTKDGYDYPGRYIEYLWDGPNMKMTNFELANQFVKREYRKGWGALEL